MVVVMPKIFRLAASRRKSERGGVAVTFAVSLVVIVSLVGVAIDVIRFVYAREMLQSSLDSAMTAAAAESLAEDPGARPDPAKMQAAAKRSFDANFTLSEAYVPKREFKAEFNAAGAPENSMKGVVDAEVSLTFPRLLGWRTATVPMHLESVATRPRASPSEIALALDVTGSMNDTWDGQRRTSASQKSKLDDLKEAVTGLIEYVMESEDVKIALVPFTNFVNVGVTTRGNWLEVPADWRLPWPDLNCTVEKTNCVTNENDTCTNLDTGATFTCKTVKCDTKTVCTDYRTMTFTGCVPPRGTTANNVFTPLNNISNPTNPKYVGVLLGSCAVPQMTDLTGKSGKSDLLAKVRTLPYVDNQATGVTFQPNGLIWGWNMLDPAEPFTTASSASDNTKPKKSIVLVTDGINSAFPSSRTGYVTPDRGVQNQPKANTLTAETCKQIQDTTDIYIYVVAINDPDATTDQAQMNRAMLEACASPRGKYYNVRNKTELNNAFKQIGKAFTYNTLVN